MEAVNSFLSLEKNHFLISLQYTFFFYINQSHTYTAKNLGH